VTSPLTCEQAQKQLNQQYARLDELAAGLDRAEFDVKARAAELGADVEKIVAFVRDEVAYEVYPGVLRGAKGTFLGRAGNAPDKSLLLAELLKARGFSVRFVKGTLDDNKAQALVRQMLHKKPPAVSQAKLDGELLKSFS
jgi:transglutaminase-like putative cysteine protease